MSIRAASRRVSEEQQAIDTIMELREQSIRLAVKPGRFSIMPPGALSTSCPFTIHDFLPDMVDVTFKNIREINSQLVTLQWNRYYVHDLKKPNMQKAEFASIEQYCRGIEERANRALDAFITDFINGKADIRSLPLPERPFVIGLSHTKNRLAEARGRLQLKCNRNKKNAYEDTIASLEIRNNFILNIGHLHTQLQFLHFIQQNNDSGIPLQELTIEDLQAWRDKFKNLESEQLNNRSILKGIHEAFSSATEVEKGQQKKRKKKHKKKKKKAAPPQPNKAEEANQPIIQVEPKVDVAAQKRVQLNIRLNQLQDESVCGLHPRVKRWGQIDLNDPGSLESIRAFIDFNPNNQAIKLYDDLSLPDLRRHKENHDIPLHTILREKDLAACYSFHQIHRNARNEAQHTRVFYAEKTTFDESGKPCRELGLIHAAVDSEGTVYHSMFKKTSHVEISEVTRQHAYPDAEEHAEEKEDGAQPFQFFGNYHIEIDPKDDSIVIKIGQDGEPNQVIYKIPLL